VAVVHSRAVKSYAILTTLVNEPGMLFQLTRVFADQQANISYIDVHTAEAGAQGYIEFTIDGPVDQLLTELGALACVSRVEQTPPFSKIYGKRIIVMGGGAQVGQVAMGAISEADRHNIRGERISVDTIPLVGEEELAAAVRAVPRLPRVRLLVLAGSGGSAAERPVRDLVEHGRQRARCGGSGGFRSRAGWRDGRDGDRRHGEVRHHAAAEAEVLNSSARV
jgi:energy-converting hydrogenase B subunit Q